MSLFMYFVFAASSKYSADPAGEVFESVHKIMEAIINHMHNS